MLLFKWLVFLNLQLQCHFFKEASSDRSLLFIPFLALLSILSSPLLPLESKPCDSGTIRPTHQCIPSSTNSVLVHTASLLHTSGVKDATERLIRKVLLLRE